MQYVRPLVVAFFLISVLVAARVVSLNGSALSDALPSPAAQSTRYAVILVLDGARYDQFDMSKMPNLAALAGKGAVFTRATVGQLPSITETSHATIGTGVYPNKHGVLGDRWRVPGTAQLTPTLLDGNLIRSGYLEKLLQKAGTPSIAGIIHGRFKGSVVVSLSGHKTYAASAMSAGHADYVAFGVRGAGNHFVPGGIPGRTPDKTILSAKRLDLPAYPRAAGVEDSWATTLAIKMLGRYHPRVMMVNYPEPDNAGHTYGPDPTKIGPILQSFDKDLGRLVNVYRKAGILADTDFVITSDHGMVSATNKVNSNTLFSVIRGAGGDPLLVGHGDYSAIWLKNPGATAKVAAALQKAAVPHVSGVFEKTAGKYTLVSSPTRFHVPAVQASYQDLLQSFDRPESADIVLTYDENTITYTDLFRKVGRKGDHEGASWGSQHITMILSGAGVRSGYTSEFPARLVDVAPTVEMLLGAKPRRQDGVPLADAMTDAPATATSAQKNVEASRSAHVTALQQEAKQTLAARTNR